VISLHTTGGAIVAAYERMAIVFYAAPSGLHKREPDRSYDCGGGVYRYDLHPVAYKALYDVVEE
jgi:hypothetical protein